MDTDEYGPTYAKVTVGKQRETEVEGQEIIKNHKLIILFIFFLFKI